MTTTVADNPASSRFEITVDGEALAGFLDYRKDGDAVRPAAHPDLHAVRGSRPRHRAGHRRARRDRFAPAALPSPIARSSPRSSAIIPSSSSSCPRISEAPSGSNGSDHAWAATFRVGSPGGRSTAGHSSTARRGAQARRLRHDSRRHHGRSSRGAARCRVRLDHGQARRRQHRHRLADTGQLVLDLDAKQYAAQGRAVLRRRRDYRTRHRPGHRVGRALPQLRAIRRVEGHPRAGGPAPVRRSCLDRVRSTSIRARPGRSRTSTRSPTCSPTRLPSRSATPARSPTSMTRSAPVRRLGRPSGSSWNATQLNDERAFAFLTRLSQARNVKLRLIATEIVADVEKRRN